MNIRPKEEYIPLTPTAFHTLLALAEKPMYSNGVVSQCEFDAEHSLKFDRASVHRTIQRLTNLGLITSSDELTRKDSRGHVHYRLTEIGREVLQWECGRYQAAAYLGKSRLARFELKSLHTDQNQQTINIKVVDNR